VLVSWTDNLTGSPRWEVEQSIFHDIFIYCNTTSCNGVAYFIMWLNFSSVCSTIELTFYNFINMDFKTFWPVMAFKFPWQLFQLNLGNMPLKSWNTLRVCEVFLYMPSRPFKLLGLEDTYVMLTRVFNSLYTIWIRQYYTTCVNICLTHRSLLNLKVFFYIVHFHVILTLVYKNAWLGSYFWKTRHCL
jgi:hypothetical protein